MALQTDNLLLQDAGVPRTLSSADTIRLTGALEVAQSLTVEGNLVVQGSTTALEQERLLVEDNHILLNSGYTTVAAQTAGIVSNYLPTATTDTVNGSFTAGVVSTSNPTVVTTGSGTFSASDIVLISAANNPGNNGIFEVLSHTGTTLTVRGVGTTGTVEDFTNTDFVADSTVAGTITKVNVSVLRAGTDGAWEQASGSATGLSFTDLGSGTGNSLNQAYIVGNTITTDAGNGTVIIAGTEALQVTASGGLNVDTVADFDVTTFDVQMTATNGFSIDGTAASNVSVTGGNMTVSTLSTGTLILDGVALVDINAGANLDIDVTGTFDMLSTGVFSIDGTGASNVTANTGNLTLSTTTSGGVLINSAGDSTYTVPNGSATAWLLTDGTDNYLRVDSTNNQLEIIAPFVEWPAGSAGGVVLTTDDALAQGDIVFIKATTGNIGLADANAGTVREAAAVGVARTTVTAANPAQIFTQYGALIPIRFTSAPAAADNGRAVYLSQTAGQATMTAPTGASDVIYRLGFLQNGDGADTTPMCMWAPQFIARGASVTDT